MAITCSVIIVLSGKIMLKANRDYNNEETLFCYRRWILYHILRRTMFSLVTSDFPIIIIFYMNDSRMGEGAACLRSARYLRIFHFFSVCVSRVVCRACVLWRYPNDNDYMWHIGCIAYLSARAIVEWLGTILLESVFAVRSVTLIQQ